MADNKWFDHSEQNNQLGEWLSGSGGLIVGVVTALIGVAFVALLIVDLVA